MPKAKLEELIAELDFPTPSERRRGESPLTTSGAKPRPQSRTMPATGERRRGRRRREDRDMQLIGPAWLDQGDS